MEKKIVRLNKRQKNKTQINVSLENENDKKISKMNLNKYENSLNNNQKNKKSEIMNYGNKGKDFLPLYNQQNFQINLDKEINISDLGTNDFLKTFIKSEISSRTNSNLNDNNINSRNMSLMNFIDNKFINQSLNNNMNKSTLTFNRNGLLKDNNLSFNTNEFNTNKSIKISKLRENYFDFIQKHYEDNNKNNEKLDTNNKELLQKCNELIHDNKLLNQGLDESNNKLNIILQENLSLKSELDKSILSNKKNEQKIIFYEEQLNLFKNNNENYQKIIKELKQQNDQLNSKLNKIKTTNEENKKKNEEKYKNDIEEIKKNMQESFNTKMKLDDKYYDNKIKNLTEEINKLKETNKDLRKQLESKEKVIELMYKDNEKLTNQNKLNNIQIEQNTKQISDLKTMIKHKDNLIKNLKSKEIETEKIFFNKSNSSLMKFENSEFISENLTKLISDNEENRMKIEFLNDKLKTIDEIERKYTQLVKDNRNVNSTGKHYTNVPNTTPRERRYNNKNHKFYTSINNNVRNNLTLKDNQINKLKNNLSPKKNNTRNSIDKKVYISSSSLPPKNINMYKSDLSRNEIRNKRNTREIREIKVIKENKENKIKNEIKKVNKRDTYPKNRKVLTLKKEMIKEDKSYDKENKNKPFKGRNYYKIEGNKTNEKIIFFDTDRKEYNEEKNESKKKDLKDYIWKKNLTFKKKLNFSSEEIINDENNNDSKIITNISKIEEEKENKKNDITYYLYGIDRNDFFHSFDIKNKIWEEKKNILELRDKSNSFRKDYQYEGTLLYNTLEGVYILTGEKTDILYYFNSKTNLISKICKFNNSHNNGSIMLDTNNNCIYVFGGKKITSCEYYSFKDKKVYNLPDLITDRANASFIISNNKIFGFFGFSYGKDEYAKTIEYIDYNKKDKWVELTDITFLKKNILFDIESTSTMYYKQNPNLILIYSGIQGNDEDFVTDYYLLYDVKNNTMDKINKWNLDQYKLMDEEWREYEMKNTDQKGFHFAKNNRFILIPNNCVPEGYNKNDLIDALIDYKNNVHFINQEKKQIDIYRGIM